MIIEVDESFKIDFNKLKNKQLENRIIKKIEDIEKVEKFYDISNLKKMKGFDNFYRIRVCTTGISFAKDYRIGFEFTGTKIILLRVRNRKDIYDVFP